MFRDPQEAARAWVAAHPEWEFDGEGFDLVFPPSGRQKEPTRRRVMCGGWADFASGLMRSGILVKADEGWVLRDGSEDPSTSG